MLVSGVHWHFVFWGAAVLRQTVVLDARHDSLTAWFEDSIRFFFILSDPIRFFCLSRVILICLHVVCCLSIVQSIRLRFVKFYFVYR